MKHLSSLLHGSLSAALLMLLWLACPAARAQAPAWQSAMIINQASSTGAGLAPGLYAVQVLAGAATATRRLVVE